MFEAVFQARTHARARTHAYARVHAQTRMNACAHVGAVQAADTNKAIAGILVITATIKFLLSDAKTFVGGGHERRQGDLAVGMAATAWRCQRWAERARPRRDGR